MQNDPSALYETAQQLVASGNLAGAEIMLRQAVEKASHDPTMYLAGLATLLGLQGREEESVDLLQVGLGEHPDDPHLLVAYGLTMEATGKAEEAEDFFRQAVDVDPEHPAALHGLAGIMLRKGEVEEAERMACKAFWVAPDHADFALTACHLLEATGKADLAYEVAQLGAAYNPQDMDLVQRAVEGALAREEPERALEILGESDGQAPWVVGWKATVLEVAGQREEADELLALGREKCPEDVNFLFCEACIHQRRGDTDAVLTVLDRILEKEPRHLGALKLRSELFVEEQAVEQAIESLERVQELSPDPETAWELVGAYYRSGSYGKCLERCADLVPEEGDPPPLLQVYRMLCLAALEREEALEYVASVPADLIGPALDEMGRAGAGTELEDTVRERLLGAVPPGPGGALPGGPPEKPPPSSSEEVGPPPIPLVGVLEEQYRLEPPGEEFEWAQQPGPGEEFEWVEELETEWVDGVEEDDAEYEWIEVEEDE